MLGSRLIRPLGVFLALSLAHPAQAAVLTACTAAEIIAQDAGCPPGTGACTITKSFEIAAGDCHFDFGSRAVVLQGQISSSATIYLDVGSLTMEPGSALRGKGVFIEAHGDVWVQRQDRYVRGVISTVGRGYDIGIETPGHFRLDGELLVDASQEVDAQDAGNVSILAGAGIITGEDSVISGNTLASSYDYASTGEFDLIAKGPIVLRGTISMLGDGSDEGDLQVLSEDDAIDIGGRVRLDGWYAGRDGGTLLAYANTGVTISGKVTTVGGPTTLADVNEFGPESGQVLVTVDSGDVHLTGEIVVDGVLGGLPGLFCVDAGDGSIFASGTFSARAHRLHSATAEFALSASKRIEFSGSLNVANGSNISIEAADIELSGSITGRILASGMGTGDELGLRIVGEQVRISGDIDLSASGCENGICPLPWPLEIWGTQIEISSEATIRDKGRVGGQVLLKGQSLAVAGLVDARGDDEDGFVDLEVSVFCSITGTVVPTSLFGVCSPETMLPTPTPTAVGSPPATPTPTATLVSCAGDCDATLTVDRIDLWRALAVINLCPADADESCGVFTPEESCPTADLDHDGVLSAGELTRMVAKIAGGGGCP